MDKTSWYKKIWNWFKAWWVVIVGITILLGFLIIGMVGCIKMIEIIEERGLKPVLEEIWYGEEI